jgi:hypothetical protein
MLAFVLLLTLGLGEPFLCIVHCQIWLPLAYHGYFAAQHQHQHQQHIHTAGAPAAQPVASAAIVQPRLALAGGGCIIRPAENSNVPFHVPPSPVHDLLLALLVAIVALRLLARYPMASSGDPPYRSIAPPLRPPIPA